MCTCKGTMYMSITYIVLHTCMQAGFLLGRRKNQSCEAHCSWEVGGGLGICFPRKCVNFGHPEVASGGF